MAWESSGNEMEGSKKVDRATISCMLPIYCVTIDFCDKLITSSARIV